MQDKRSARSTAPISRSIASRLLSPLLRGFYRMFGLCAVYVVPSFILGPRRVVRLARTYPLAAAAACACLLAGAFLWNGDSRPSTAEFEFESIDNIDPAGDLLADVDAVRLDDPLDAAALASVVEDAPPAERRKRHMPKIPKAFSAEIDSPPVIWLTGDIEDESGTNPGGSVVKSADRLPTSRQ